MKIPKINSIHFGGKLLSSGLLLSVLVPMILKWITGLYSWWFLLPGGITLMIWLVLFAIEMHQDFGKEPYYEKHLSDTILFESTHQDAIIRSSICTGEMVAGFKDRENGHFTEVMVIRNDLEKQLFMKQYGITEIRKEY